MDAEILALESRREDEDMRDLRGRKGDDAKGGISVRQREQERGGRGRNKDREA